MQGKEAAERRNPAQHGGTGDLKRIVEKQMDLNHLVSVRRSLMAAPEDPPELERQQSRLSDLVVMVAEKAKGDGLISSMISEAPTRRGSVDAGQGGLTHVKKEACQMLRFFVYGKVGNEFAKSAKEKEAIFQESLGTQEQVIALFNLWSRLDEDGSGRVDMKEFRNFADKHMKQRLEEFVELRDQADEANYKLELAMFGGQITPEEALKFSSKLCDRLGGLVMGKKSSFVIEDMMKLIWPAATVNDMKEMWRMFRTFKNGDKNRIKTPPLLPASELNALFAVFRHFDGDRSGKVSLEELIESGLMYEDMASEMFRQWDRDGDGTLDKYEFAEMVCPSGYLAHPKAQLASLKDGTRLVFDAQLDCWRAQGSDVVFEKTESP